MTYLDYNATAPVRPEVADAVVEALRIDGNASSVHAAGRRGRQAIDAARRHVGALVGAAPDQVVFTSGGTEANNLALAAATGAVTLPVDRRGIVDLASLEGLLRQAGDGALVSVMAANNETGVVQPIEDVARLARASGTLVHCDAVQAAGRVPIDCAGLGIDFLTISAHKLGGPQGVGALVVPEGLRPAPLLRGGGQERGWRGGTENLPGIVGFGIAASMAAADIADMPRLAALRDDLERRALAAVPESVAPASSAPRLANTTCLAMPGFAAESQVIALDLAGVAVSAGAACSSGKVRPSAVLRAMGMGEALARSTIRVSLGWGSRPDDVDAFVSAWRAIADRRRRSADALEVA